MGGGGGQHVIIRELDQTATWAVAAVCGIIILISILLEMGLHHIGEWLTKRKKNHLYEALEKIKAELMVLGFISLLLTFGQNYISQICIPAKLADTMLPCPLNAEIAAAEGKKVHHHKPNDGDGSHHRRLLSRMIMDLTSKRRFLSAGGSHGACGPGMVELVSTHGLHQLHIFIFFLAVCHVFGSALTMALGRAKIRGWKDWENETESSDFECANDPQRFRFAHETSFVRQHISCASKTKISIYVASFFRQFFRSVRKTDYLSMRHGFISVHISPGSKFNFQKYIKRSLEDDFKVVVGISPSLWASAVIFLLLNVHGWNTLLWISIMPMILILAVGTKLQAIITQMALEVKERHAVVQGIPIVQVSDHHFWFGRPHLVLFLIHFTLFQNAFQLIYLLWIGYEFGWNSCFHDTPTLIAIRVALGMGVQFLCSYITLPLYALVSQMGSHLKNSIFDDHTSNAIKKWHRAAKKKGKDPTSSPPRSPNHTPRGATQPPPSAQGQQLQTIPSRRRKSMEEAIRGAEAVIPSSTSLDDLPTGSKPLHTEGNGKEDEFCLVKL